MKKILILLVLGGLLISCDNNIKQKVDNKEKSNEAIKIENEKIKVNNNEKENEKIKVNNNEKENKLEEEINIDNTDDNIENIAIESDNIGEMLKKGEYDEAEKIIKKQLENKNLDIMQRSIYLSSLAEIYINKKNYKKSQGLLFEAVKLTPKDANIYISIATNYSNLGNDNKAKEYIKKALEIEPKNEIALEFLKGLNKNK